MAGAIVAPRKYPTELRDRVVSHALETGRPIRRIGVGVDASDGISAGRMTTEIMPGGRREGGAGGMRVQ